jgi:hypothetical protein
VDALKSEFADGATPADVCARTIRALIDLGAKHFYVSNLPTKKTSAILNTILTKAGIREPGAASRNSASVPGSRFPVPD